MAVNWDTITADKCGLPKECCEHCRNFDYCTANKQMNIFEFLEAEPKDEDDSYPDFREMTSEQIAQFIGDKTGINFKQSKWDPNCYEAVIKRVAFSVHKDRYVEDIYSGKPFISCDAYKRYGDFYGCGAPIDDLESAVKFFQDKKKLFLGI